MLRTKKILLLFMSVVFLFCAIACGDNPSKKPIENTFTQDGELKATTDKTNSINMLSSKDDFGRVMPTKNSNKTDKERYVGLFYFLWSGQYNTDKVRDINQMLYDGDESLWTADNVQTFHHWGEPLLGYYNSCDPWVIRKHIELLTLADVDFLVFDDTNNRVFYDVLDVMLPIMQEYFDAGWDVPKIVFYTNANSARMIRALYGGNAHSTISDANSSSKLNREGIYKKGHYKDLWFMQDGKPLIVGITANNDGASDQTRWSQHAAFPLEQTQLNAQTDAEILNFFAIKEAQWPTTGRRNANGFPWIEFSPTATAYGDTVNVSISQHNLLPFSDALLSGKVADKMWGRGWHNGKADHSNEAIYSGANFEERYQTAIELDKKYTFVTGWNEWVAQKQYGDNAQNTGDGVAKKRVSFVDTVNTEYSRDAEMMKGGYFDNYYLQLARNNRLLKGAEATKTFVDNVEIDILKGLNQWNKVGGIYCDFVDECLARNFAGHAKDTFYKQQAATNDLSRVGIASDSDNIYFLIEATSPILVSEITKKLPTIYLSIPNNTNGFYGYHYEIDLSYGEANVNSLGKNEIESKMTRQLVGKGAYTKNGKYLQVKIPRALVNVQANFEIGFKVVDSADLSNPESFYSSGDACPAGRMNYSYFGK